MEEEGWPVRWNGPEMRLISLLVMRYSLQSDTLHGSRENHMEYYVFNTWTWTQNSQFSIVRVYWGFSLLSFFLIIIFIFRVLTDGSLMRWPIVCKRKREYVHHWHQPSIKPSITSTRKSLDSVKKYLNLTFEACCPLPPPPLTPPSKHAQSLKPLVE